MNWQKKKKIKIINQLLDQLVKEYSDNKYVGSFAACTYVMTGKKQYALKLIEKIYTLDPSDLIIRSAYARICIILGDEEKVLEIFEGTFDISKLYPNKDKFYVVEIAEFYYAAGLYFCSMDQIELAYKCKNNLLDFLDQSHPHIQDLDREIKFTEESISMYQEMKSLLDQMMKLSNEVDSKQKNFPKSLEKNKKNNY